MFYCIVLGQFFVGQLKSMLFRVFLQISQKVNFQVIAGYLIFNFSNKLCVLNMYYCFCYIKLAALHSPFYAAKDVYTLTRKIETCDYPALSEQYYSKDVSGLQNIH